MAHALMSKEIQIKNRHMKTVLFLSIMGIMFILVAIVMVQTTSQQNSVNSRAGRNKLKEANGGDTDSMSTKDRKERTAAIKESKTDAARQNRKAAGQAEIERTSIKGREASKDLLPFASQDSNQD